MEQRQDRLFPARFEVGFLSWSWTYLERLNSRYEGGFIKLSFLLKWEPEIPSKSLKIESWWKLPGRKNLALAYFKDCLIWDLHKLTVTQDLIWLFWYRLITHWRYWLQRLTDHNLIRIPTAFTNLSVRVCLSVFKAYVSDKTHISWFVWISYRKEY